MPFAKIKSLVDKITGKDKKKLNFLETVKAAQRAAELKEETINDDPHPQKAKNDLPITHATKTTNREAFWTELPKHSHRKRAVRIVESTDASAVTPPPTHPADLILQHGPEAWKWEVSGGDGSERSETYMHMDEIPLDVRQTSLRIVTDGITTNVATNLPFPPQRILCFEFRIHSIGTSNTLSNVGISNWASSKPNDSRQQSLPIGHYKDSLSLQSDGIFYHDTWERPIECITGGFGSGDVVTVIINRHCVSENMETGEALVVFLKNGELCTDKPFKMQNLLLPLKQARREILRRTIFNITPEDSSEPTSPSKTDKIERDAWLDSFAFFPAVSSDGIFELTANFGNVPYSFQNEECKTATIENVCKMLNIINDEENRLNSPQNSKTHQEDVVTMLFCDRAGFATNLEHGMLPTRTALSPTLSIPSLKATGTAVSSHSLSPQWLQSSTSMDYEGCEEEEEAAIERDLQIQSHFAPKVREEMLDMLEGSYAFKCLEDLQPLQQKLVSDLLDSKKAAASSGKRMYRV